MVRRGALTVLVAGAAVAGCGPRPDVLARVGNAQVAVEGFQRYLEAAAGQPWQAVDHRVATRVLDEYLDQEVVLVAADRRPPEDGYDHPASRTAAVRPLLAELCGVDGGPPEVVVEREIERRLDEVRPRRARVRQLLLDDLGEAAAARARVLAGEPFEEVSRQVSRAPNAASGGALGLLARGTLPREIDEVVFALDAGEVSEPVRSPSGYHVFQVLEVVPEGRRPRAELERAVRRELSDRYLGERTRSCLDRYAEDVGVRVFPGHLWFDYDGRYDGEHDAVS